MQYWKILGTNIYTVFGKKILGKNKEGPLFLRFGSTKRKEKLTRRNDNFSMEPTVLEYQSNLGGNGRKK